MLSENRLLAIAAWIPLFFVTVAQGAAQRVVTLAPNLTELAYAAGAGERLVGAVLYSDYPEAARRLPHVGDAFRVDPERLLALKPDLVLAWSSGTPQVVIENLRAFLFTVARNLIKDYYKKKKKESFLSDLFDF